MNPKTAADQTQRFVLDLLRDEAGAVFTGELLYAAVLVATRAEAGRGMRRVDPIRVATRAASLLARGSGRDSLADAYERAANDMALRRPRRKK